MRIAANGLTTEQRLQLQHKLYSFQTDLLKYRKIDGAFGAFEDENIKGSIWLTAYVMSLLPKLRTVFEIDDSIQEQALSFLSKNQAADGSFEESEDVCINAKQNNKLAITAQVLLAFAHGKDPDSLYVTQIERATNYILEQLEKTDSLYAKAIATYALRVVGYEKITEKFDHLMNAVKTNGNQTWLSQTTEINNDDIEATAYLLLTALNLDTEKTENYLPIVLWLIEHGGIYEGRGFYPTQTVIVSLTALTQYAAKTQLYRNGSTMRSVARFENVYSLETSGTSFEKATSFRKWELSNRTKSLESYVSGDGNGIIFTHFDFQYGVEEIITPKNFDIKVELPTFDVTPIPDFVFKACVKYLSGKESMNLNVLEVNLPTGYVAFDDSINEITQLEHVKHVSLSKSKTLFRIYMNKVLSTDFQCVPIKAQRYYEATLLKPAWIVVYEYNNYAERDMINYTIPSAVCDVCQPNKYCYFHECRKN